MEAIKNKGKEEGSFLYPAQLYNIRRRYTTKGFYCRETGRIVEHAFNVLAHSTAIRYQRGQEIMRSPTKKTTSKSL